MPEKAKNKNPGPGVNIKQGHGPGRVANHDLACINAEKLRCTPGVINQQRVMHEQSVRPGV